MRGTALSDPDLVNDLESLEKLNHRFAKAEKVHWFECESYSQAQIIVDQMMNRRFPYEDEAICNISDPGATWWLYKEKKKYLCFLNPWEEKKSL